MNPDLSSTRILPGRDFVFWTGPVVDMVGHGTHVAGTILQETNNGLGVAGIAHRARLMPLKACFGYWEIHFALSARGTPGFVHPDDTGGCTDAAIAEAIRYAADNSAHVINLSLGGEDPSPVILQALQYAVGRGLFVSIAAGNAYRMGNPIIYPAKYAEEIAGVVSVGAVGRSSRRAYYSTTGSYVELAAPGGDAQDGGLEGLVYQSSMVEQDFDPRRIVQPGSSGMRRPPAGARRWRLRTSRASQHCSIQRGSRFQAGSKLRSRVSLGIWAAAVETTNSVTNWWMRPPLCADADSELPDDRQDCCFGDRRGAHHALRGSRTTPAGVQRVRRLRRHATGRGADIRGCFGHASYADPGRRDSGHECLEIPVRRSRRPGHDEGR
jgi:hypothetical protein